MPVKGRKPHFGMGHNNGPTMEKGRAWRRHCWTKARQDLLPRMPLEVVRLRMKRARELGLDYKTYATVRATSGTDIIAFLFSTNALRLLKSHDTLSTDHVKKLGALVRTKRLIAVQPPLSQQQVGDCLSQHDIAVSAITNAPTMQASWSEQRERMSSLTRGAGVKSGAVLLVGDTALEREWVAAGRLAGFLSSDRYFALET